MNEDSKISKNVLEALTKEAFDVFDQEGRTGSIDVRDVGHIIRSLGVNPSQSEMNELLSDITENGRVDFGKLQPKIVTSILAENKMVRDDENKIKRAFQVIDAEKKGYIDPEKLAGLLSTHGEVFAPEEIEEMFSVAVDSGKGVIFYEDYSTLLAND